MQEIYNKNKCQHIGKWKSNYTDKTMQIRTHIVFHSQLASHKNITVFRFRENKACITCNKQTMEARKLENRRMRKYTKTTTMLNKKAPTHTSKHTHTTYWFKRETKSKHEQTHKWALFSLSFVVVCLFALRLTFYVYKVCGNMGFVVLLFFQRTPRIWNEQCSDRAHLVFFSGDRGQRFIFRINHCLFCVFKKHLKVYIVCN